MAQIELVGGPMDGTIVDKPAKFSGGIRIPFYPPTAPWVISELTGCPTPLASSHVYMVTKEGVAKYYGTEHPDPTSYPST